MNVEIYINASRADYGEKINVQYAVGDIADIASGRNNKSFKIALPMTDTNRAIFQYIDSVTVFDELAATGYISVDGAIIIQGRAVLQSVTDTFNIIITAEDWIDEIEGLSLKDLDLSALDHAYTESVITTAWASGTTYQYPLINFGKLSDPNSSDVGEVSAETSIQDYYPMFRIKEIIEKIFDRWTINSAFLATAEFLKYYIYSHPAVKDDDFIQDKDFLAYIDSYLDNYASAVLGPSVQASVTLDKTTYATRVDIDGEDHDLGSNYAVDRYTIPETGTYHFLVEMDAIDNTDASSYTIDSQSLTYKIVRRRSAADTDLVTFTTSTLATWRARQTLDTGRVHCEAGDEIWVSAYLTMEFTNNDGVDRTFEVTLDDGSGVERCEFYSDIDEWCLFPGEGITVDTEAWLPDITQIDFLRAIKQMFNLRFGVDRNAQTIRIEPHDDFFTTNERDWTEYVDNAEVDQDLVSIEYAAKQRFKFREDSGDTALLAYKIANATLPNTYDHSLSSVNTKDGIDEIESPAFADTTVGNMRPMHWWIDVVKIWGELTDGYPFPLKRIRSWEPRIFYYDGATAGPRNLEFEGTGYANYPKVSVPDWNDLFDDYWINNFHLIDAGKLVIVQAAIPVSEIQRFIMVVGNETTEGFRARYKVKIGNDTFMATVNRIVYNGAMAKVELIILK